MSEDQEFRTISFDDQEVIEAAIKNHENFEIGGCQNRMSEAVLFAERAIGAEGMTSRVYTKGRAKSLFLGLALPAVAVATSVSIVAHNLATLNPDYEVLKRQLNGSLRLLYVKDEPMFGGWVSDAYKKVFSGSSESKVSTAEAWNKQSLAQAAKIKSLQKHLEKAAKKFTEQNMINEFTICLYAVGISIAACDGNFDDDEAFMLKKHILGEASLVSSSAVNAALEQLTEHPPTFYEAMTYVEKLSSLAWPVIDDVLTLISEADGVVSEEELSYMAKWEEFKSNSTQKSIA